MCVCCFAGIAIKIATFIYYKCQWVNVKCRSDLLVSSDCRRQLCCASCFFLWEMLRICFYVCFSYCGFLWLAASSAIIYRFVTIYLTGAVCWQPKFVQHWNMLYNVPCYQNFSTLDYYKVSLDTNFRDHIKFENNLTVWLMLISINPFFNANGDIDQDLLEDCNCHLFKIYINSYFHDAIIL